MRIQRGEGFYLIVSEYHEGDIPEPDDMSKRWFATDKDIVAVGIAANEGPISFHSATSYDVPDDLDSTMWDEVLETVVEARGPLLVSNWDFTPPAEAYPPLTDGPGTWNVRIGIRTAEHARAIGGEYMEEHLAMIWPVDAES